MQHAGKLFHAYYTTPKLVSEHAHQALAAWRGACAFSTNSMSNVQHVRVTPAAGSLTRKLDMVESVCCCTSEARVRPTRNQTFAMHGSIRLDYFLGVFSFLPNRIRSSSTARRVCVSQVFLRTLPPRVTPHNSHRNSKYRRGSSNSPTQLSGK